MKTITITKNVFNYEELSEKAQERAREEYREAMGDYDEYVSDEQIEQIISDGIFLFNEYGEVSEYTQ